MFFRRTRHRRWIALLALLGLLFQQLAMVAYACPLGVDGDILIDSASKVSTTTSSCAIPAAPDPARCQQHCHPLNVSADHAPTLGVPPALLPATTWLREIARISTVKGDYPACEIAARAASPPLTVQHCTFQI